MSRVVYALLFVGLLAMSARVAGQLSRPTLLPPQTPLRPSDQAFDLLETFLGSAGTPSPDIGVAAGWAHLVLARNAGITLFRKSNGTEPTKQLASMSMSAFFARVLQTGDALTDPYVIFDPDGGRFFLVLSPSPSFAQMNPPLAVLLAVSKSSYPETLTDTDWYVYRLSREETVNAVDFDKLAVAGDTLLLSWPRAERAAQNDINRGTTIQLLDKRALMSGTVPNPTNFVLAGEANSPLSRGVARPASVASSRDRQRERDRMFFDINTYCGRTNRLIWLVGAVAGIGTTARVDTREVTSPFPCGSGAPGMPPQPGGQVQLMAGGNGTAPAYYDGRLWVFADQQAASGVTTSGLQWMELDVRGWPDAISVMQSGTYTEPGVWFYAPGAAVDWAGNLVLTFVRSGPNDYPSAYYTGRLVIDPLGTLRPARPLQTGTRAWAGAPYAGQPTAGNFLDYSTVSVDPADGSVWITGLVPSPALPSGPNESSDAWIGRVRPIDTTPTGTNGTVRQ